MNNDTIIIDYNYLLKLVDNIQISYLSIEAAAFDGFKFNAPFTVEMLTPSMIVCEWQPGMAQVKYTNEYKRWYEDQQSGYERIAGQPTER